jgi:hypothetical protein
MRQITRGEFQGTVAPPNSRPSSSIRTKPMIDRLPNQSIALRPSRIGVLGLWTSRYRNNKMKVVPEMGRLIQKFHRQETLSVKTPPRTGPTPPAITQTSSMIPMYRLRLLLNVSLFQERNLSELKKNLMLNKSEMVIMINGIKPPHATPWNVLPMIRTFILPALAQKTEEAKNNASAARKIGLRPNISESLAQIGPEAALERRYAPPIQT